MTSDLLLDEINKFFIDLGGGYAFWAPYLINTDYSQKSKPVHGLGKSSPEDILRAAKKARLLRSELSVDELKKSLIDGSYNDPDIDYKAIDCSGFTYYVIDGVLQKSPGERLAKYLSVPKSHVLNGAYNLDEWKNAYTLSDEEAKSLPEDVPMEWVIEKFQRKPVNLCRVAGLVSDYSSVGIEFDSARVGDLVHMSTPGSNVPHVAIVMHKEKDVFKIVHSSRANESDPGGVRMDELHFDGTHYNTSKLDKPRTIIGLRRLKAFI